MILENVNARFSKSLNVSKQDNKIFENCNKKFAVL
jgi:hypothetical protein